MKEDFIPDICIANYILRGFPGSSDGKKSAYNARDLGLIPGLGRSPGRGHGNSLQYSCLENSMDRPWGGKSQTRLSDFHSLHSLYSQVASCFISSFSCDAGSIFSHWKVRR